MDRNLLEAARTGNVEYLHRLIGENPFLLESVGLRGAETPLHVASLCGHFRFVKKILELKPQFAYDLNQDGYTPLHLASVNGHLEIVVELLKQCKQKCILKGKEQWIPLHCAVVKGRTHVMQELLSSYPKSAEMKTALGETSLHLAVKNNQFESLKLLVKHLLHWKMDSVLNEKDNQGNTILHLAALRKQYQVVHLLLSDVAVPKGAVEVNSKNESGMTPLDVLQEFHNEDQEIETILLKAGAESYQFASRCDELEDFFKYKKGRDKPSDVRTALLTVAGLMLAATYQAALSPPSGLWQDNNFNEINPIANVNETHPIANFNETRPIAGGLSLASPPRGSTNEHKAGTSILASREELLFISFVFGNTVGFYTAIFTIVFLTTGFPMQLELRVSLLGITITYVSAMYGIIPDPKTTLAFVIFSFLLFISVTVLLKLLRKLHYRNGIVRRCIDLIKSCMNAKVRPISE